MKSLHLSLVLLVVLLLAGPQPTPAAERDTTTVVVSAQRCVLPDGSVGALAVSASTSASSVSIPGHGGMLVGVKTVDSHPQEVLDLVAALHAVRVRVGTTRAGRYAEFEGRGSVHQHGTRIEDDPRAFGYATEDGRFLLRIGARLFAGQGVGGIGFDDVPAPAHGDTGRHEVGHWLGLYHTFDGGSASALWVAAPLGDGLEGYPEVAGLFKDTAEGETGHAHGHLDFLKSVGDPATGRARPRDRAFEGAGTMTFEFEGHRPFDAGVLLDTDPGTREAVLALPALGLELTYAYRALPPRGPGVLLHVPAP